MSSLGNNVSSSRVLGRTSDPLVSVVVPAYNEGPALAGLLAGVRGALAGQRLELVVVNDGSEDDSAVVLDRLAAEDPSLKVVHLSRNFGHQSALLAGLRHTRGDAVVVMDADLQDDPAALPRFLAKWTEGYDVVYAIRVGRKEGALQRLLFFAFYRLLNAVSRVEFPNDAGNFGLVDSRVCRLVAGAVERDRYFPGLRGWVGFRQIGIEVERGERYDAVPRVSRVGLVRLAKTAIFSFSTVPLTVFYLIAALSMVAFVALAAFTLVQKLFTGTAILGWTSTIMTMCFFGSLNALGIAILGEYIARIYDQVRGRPQFVIERTVNLEPEALGAWSDAPGARDRPA